MKNEFTKVMSERSDEELIKIVTVDKEKYNKDAIEAAEFEFNKRNLDTAKIAEVTEKAIIQKSNTQTVNKNVVSSFTRFLNFIIDFFCLNIVFAVIAFVLGIFISVTSVNEGILSLLVILIYLTTIILYYSLMEIKFQKTVGKFITKTKVVKLTGEKPDNSEIIARSFYRLLPFDRISFLFTRNGFHDYLSKTKVVKDSAE